MSTITNIILTFHLINDSDKFEKEMIEYFKSTDRPKERLLSCNDSLEFPSYALESSVYVGAFNYFDEEEFIEWLESLEWYDKSSVQLFICRQEENRFTEIQLKGLK